MWRPSAFRLRPIAFSAGALALVTVATVAGFAVVSGEARDVFQRREQAQLSADRDLLAGIYETHGFQRTLEGVSLEARHASPSQFFGLFSPGDHRPLAGNIQSIPQPFAPRRGAAGMARDAAGRPVRMFALGSQLPNGAVLVVGRDEQAQLAFQQAFLEGVLVAFSIVIASSLAVGIALGAILAGRAEAIASTAEEIAGGRLGARVRVRSRGDPFDRIGAAMNSMMDQIEELMNDMRALTDSLAHDLRTPLTWMRSALEQAADPAASPEVRDRAIQTAEAASLHALKLFTDLIDIARAESGMGRELMTQVDLPAVALELAEFFGPTFEDAGQRLVVGDLPAVTVIGHEPLIRQAVGNLLLNAVKYAGGSARVTLEVFRRDGQAGFIVGDDGPGVPEEDRGRVQARFVRLDAARTLPGSGLGLAIVAACAKLHRGELSLQDNHGGLRAVVSLPLAIVPEGGAQAHREVSLSASPAMRMANVLRRGPLQPSSCGSSETRITSPLGIRTCRAWLRSLQNAARPKPGTEASGASSYSLRMPAQSPARTLRTIRGPSGDSW